MDAATLPSFVRRRMDRRERYGLRLTLFGIAVVLAVLPFAYVLDQVVDEGPLTVYDQTAAERLHEVVADHPGLRTPLEVVGFLGKPIFFYVVVGALCVWLFIQAQRRIIAYLVTTGMGGGAVDTAVKVLVDRDRPDIDGAISAFGKSFPSGHTFTATVMYGAMLVAFYGRIPHKLRGLAIAGYIVIVGAIAFSRLALGAHFLTDVIGGAVLGLAWLLASTAAFRMWKRGE